MKELRRRKGLSGTVLIMILTVMVVLIIMLMATLTVVTTANQRVYTKFEENQAYYSARSALDIFTANLMNDGDYYAYENGNGSARMYTYTKTGLDPAVDDITNPANQDTKEMMQGLALQLDLYKIRSQGETAKKLYGDDEAFDFVENAILGDGTFITGSAEDANYTLDSHDIGIVSGRVGLDYIEYDIEFPKVTDGSGNNYGKLVDEENALTGDKNKDGLYGDVAMIKVEVLDRIYATSSTYTMDDLHNIVTGADDSLKDALRSSIQKGKRTKDEMRIKITSTVKMMDTEGVAVVILKTNEVKAPDSSNAINSLGGLTGSGAGLVAAGGASSLNTGNTQIDASGTAGTIFSLGHLDWNSSGSSTFDESASVYARGGIKFTNSQNITAVGDDAFIYAEGPVEIVSGFTYGNAEHPMSIICTEMKYDNAITVYGNIYTEKMNLGGNNGAQKVGGNAKIYTQDLYASTAGNGVFVNSDGGYIEVNAADGSEVHMYGDLYIDGVKASEAYPGFEIRKVTREFGTFDLFNKTPTDVDGKIMLEVTLPADLPSGSTNTIYLHTTNSRFKDYFDPDAFDENGDLINQDTGVVDGDSYTSDNIKDCIITAEKMFYTSNSMTIPDNPTLNLYSENVSITDNTITESGILPYSNGTLTVDTSGGVINLQLVAGVTYGGQIQVVGDGSLNILMPELDAAGEYRFENFSLYNSEVNNVAGETVENGTTKAPKINYFVGDKADVRISNNAFFIGYFYMPLSTLHNSSGNNGVGKEYKYNGTTTNKNYFIVGSVTCGDYDTGGSNSGVCFLDPNSGDSQPGKPHLSLRSSQYTRS